MYFPTIKTSYGAYNYIYSEGLQFIPTLTFSTLDFSTINSSTLDSYGAKKFMVEWSGIVKSGVEMSRL